MYVSFKNIFAAYLDYLFVVIFYDVDLVIIESKAPPEAKSENGNHCKVNIEPRHPDDNEGSEDHTMIVDETKTLLQDQSRPKRISFSKLSPVVTPEDNNGGLTVSKNLEKKYHLPQWARKFKKFQAKKLLKSNKSI